MTEEIAVRIVEALEAIDNSIGLLTAALAFLFGLAIFMYIITKD